MSVKSKLSQLSFLLTRELSSSIQSIAINKCTRVHRKSIIPSHDIHTERYKEPSLLLQIHENRRESGTTLKHLISPISDSTPRPSFCDQQWLALIQMMGTAQLHQLSVSSLQLRKKGKILSGGLDCLFFFFPLLATFF